MNFASFDLNLLRVFDALMRERSATRAGEQVGLSQPAVSAALNRLRDLLGDRLFIRQGNDMVPTPRAETLAPGIQDALQSLERILSSSRMFDPGKLERSFTIMASDFFLELVVPQLSDLLASASSGISLRILDTARGDVERMLNDDAIDIALEPELNLPEWISNEQLFVSPFKIIVARDNPLVKGLDARQPLPIAKISELQWALRSVTGTTRGLIDETLEKIGQRRKVVLTLPHFMPVLRRVAASNLAAAVPSQFAEAFAEQERLLVFDFPFEGPSPRILMHWHSRRTRDPAHAWLRKQINQICAPIRDQGI
jgi:DNA-binding transcriptional LysR family regulator